MEVDVRRLRNCGKKSTNASDGDSSIRGFRLKLCEEDGECHVELTIRNERTRHVEWTDPETNEDICTKFCSSVNKTSREKNEHR